MKIKVNDALGTSLLITFYWGFILIYYLTGMDSVFFTRMRAILGGIALAVCFLKKKDVYEARLMKRECIIVVVVIVLGLISSVYNHNNTILAYIFMMLANAGIAMIMIHYKLNEKLMWSLFLFFCFILISYFANAGNLNEIFIEKYLSRNYISVFLLTFMLLICLSSEGEIKWGKSLLSPFLLLFSILVGGRGGIISALFLCIIAIPLIIRDSKYSEKRFYVLFVALAIIVLGLMCIYLGQDAFLERFLGHYFYSLGFNDVRFSTMYAYYLRKLSNPADLFLGADIREQLYEAGGWGHLHNTYLMVHARFGLVGLIFIVLCMFKSLKSYWKSDRLIAAVIATFMVRIFTDTVFTMMIFDSLLFFFIFKAACRTEESRIAVRDASVSYMVEVKRGGLNA